MTVSELTRDQKIELKMQMLIDRGDVSWGELAEADNLVSDEELEEEFAGTDFVTDDFLSVEYEGELER